MIVPITDSNAPQLDIYTKLHESALKHYFEPNGGLFIAESAGVISLALDAGYRPISIVATSTDIAGTLQPLISRLGDIPVYAVNNEIVDKIQGFHLIRGAMCAMHRNPLPDVSQICKNATRIAVLDGVENPTNVGAIIRSAAALGIDALVVSSDSADPLYRRAARVSMGTVFQVPWTVTSDYMPALRDLGFKTVAMALRDDSVDISSSVLLEQERLAIILGSEGYGLSPKIIDKCDFTVKIPMHHGVDSLNVAAASAVAFFALKNR